MKSYPLLVKPWTIYINKYLFFHALIGILIGIVLMFSTLIESQNGAFIYPLSLFVVFLYFWCLISWKKLTGNLFNPYILFLTSIMLFNAGQSFLYLFDLMPYGYMNGIFSYSTIEKSLLYVSLSIYSLHMGALIAVKKDQPIVDARDGTISSKALRRVGWFLFFISVGSTIVLLQKAVSIVLSNGYFALYQTQEVVTGFSNIHQVLSAFLIPSAIFMMAGSKNKRSTLVFSIVIILAYSLIQFFLGARAAAAMPIISFFWLFDQCIKRIPRYLIVCAFTFLLIVVFPLIASIRDASGSDKYSLYSLLDSYFSIDNPVISIFKEMGGSMAAIAHTINLVPSVRDFDLGEGYFYSILTVFPNLFWDVHPSIAHGTYSSWLVWQVDPTFASAGGGLGFSLIAESFINFSWFGLLLMAFLGNWLTKFYLKAMNSFNIPLMALVASFFSQFLSSARGESVYFVRPLLWYGVIPYILFIFIYNHYIKQRKRYGYFENKVIRDD